MNLNKRVKELEDRLIEVMSSGAIRLKELEDKLNSIQDACERVMTESSGSSPSAQLAKQISNLICK